MVKLVHLNVSANTLYSLSEHLIPTSLKYLDASFNQIKNWDGSKFKNMKTLKLNNNKVDTITFPPNVEILNINNNFLAEITGLPNGIREFFCNNNYIETFDKGNICANLTTIDLSNNKLKQIPDLGISVTELDLRGNFISYCRGLPPKLTELDISDNILSSYSIDFPASLKNVNFSNNQMLVFPKISDGIEIVECKNNKFRLIMNNKIPSSVKELTVSHDVNVDSQLQTRMGLKIIFSRPTENIINWNDVDENFFSRNREPKQYPTTNIPVVNGSAARQAVDNSVLNKRVTQQQIREQYSKHLWANNYMYNRSIPTNPYYNPKVRGGNPNYVSGESSKIVVQL